MNLCNNYCLVRIDVTIVRTHTSISKLTWKSRKILTEKFEFLVPGKRMVPKILSQNMVLNNYIGFHAENPSFSMLLPMQDRGHSWIRPFTFLPEQARSLSPSYSRWVTKPGQFMFIVTNVNIFG